MTSRPPSRLDRALDLIAAEAELVPGLLATAVFLVWAGTDGGFAPTASYPGSLFLLGLLVATVFGYRRRLAEVPRTVLIALALLTAFTVWTFLSITWAGEQGIAWDGANRTLLYLTVFALFAVTRWHPRSAAIILGTFSLGVAAIGLVSFLDAVALNDPLLEFIDGRLATPLDYYNANAALFLLAGWPAIFLASRREVPWPLRGPLLAAAGVLVELAILPQSRGAAIVFPIVALIYLALVPGRVRSLIVIAPLAAVAALATGDLLHVYDAIQDGRGVTDALESARSAILLSGTVLLVAGWAIGVSDRLVEVPPRLARAVARGTGVLAGVGAAAGVVIAISVIGNPASWASDRWEDFKDYKGNDQTAGEGSRFSSGLGSSRYDFWRVAVRQFEDSPVAGAGIDNFAVDYLRERDSDEEPLHPHSLPLKLLGQTGVVGTLLFGGFLVLAVVGGLGAMRASTGLGRGVAGVALVSLAYWLLHASGDWLWPFPGLTAPALAWLALSARLGPPGPEPERAPLRSPIRWALASLAGALAILAAVSYLLPWGSALEVKDATSNWAANPQAAFDRLDDAAGLNPLSPEPDLVAGAIASRIGDRERMRESFESALDRDPYSWYALLELGALDALDGDRKAALSRLAAASRLNPRDPVISDVERRISKGEVVPLAAIRRELLDRVCARFGRTHDTRYCPR